MEENVVIIKEYKNFPELKEVSLTKTACQMPKAY